MKAGHRSQFRPAASVAGWVRACKRSLHVAAVVGVTSVMFSTATAVAGFEDSYTGASLPRSSQTRYADLNEKAAERSLGLSCKSAGSASSDDSTSVSAPVIQFADQDAGVHNATKKAASEPLLIPLPTGVSAGAGFLVILGLLMTSRRVRRVMFS